jgi:uncharacterized protein (DUF58 family)
MPYILALVIVAVAVVLGIFTGVWGGLVWIVAAGLVLAAAFAFRAREPRVQSSAVEPTGEPRGTAADPGTANQRVGQR